MADEGRFQVDADAHAKAKVDGDYTPDGTGGKEKEGKSDDVAKDEDGKPIISDIDPGDDDKDDDSSDDDADGDDKEGDDKEGDDKEGDDKEGDDKKDDDADAAFQTKLQGWTTEVLENEEGLSEKSIADVKASVFAEGVPDAVKDEYIKTFQGGLQLARTAATQEAFALAGGEEKYQAMLKWGNSNLTEAERSAFDVDALGTDKGKRDTAIKGLYARMQQDQGSEPDFEPDLSHDGGRQSGEPIIGSRAELVRIQRTPEYAKDPAVREKVRRQLRQSMATGKYIA